MGSYLNIFNTVLAADISRQKALEENTRRMAAEQRMEKQRQEVMDREWTERQADRRFKEEQAERDYRLKVAQLTGKLSAADNEDLPTTYRTPEEFEAAELSRRASDLQTEEQQRKTAAEYEQELLKAVAPVKARTSGRLAEIDALYGQRPEERAHEVRLARIRASAARAGRGGVPQDPTARGNVESNIKKLMDKSAQFTQAYQRVMTDPMKRRQHRSYQNKYEREKARYDALESILKAYMDPRIPEGDIVRALQQIDAEQRADARESGIDAEPTSVGYEQGVGPLRETEGDPIRELLRQKWGR